MKIGATILSLLLAVLAGCSPKAPAHPATYRIRGEVVRLDRQPAKVTLTHDEIPGFMGSMTMPFSLKDSTLVDSLRIGDSLSAVLNVAGSHVWLDSVSVFWRESAASR